MKVEIKPSFLESALLLELPLRKGIHKMTVSGDSLVLRYVEPDHDKACH